MKMIKTLIATVSAVAILGLASTSFAAENSGKEKTISGTAKCAKCALHQTDKCQTAVEVSGKNGKTKTVLLENNDVAKNFHEQICKDSKKVKVTGTMHKGDSGKQEMAATKIEAVE
jgi:hypothetical protein